MVYVRSVGTGGGLFLAEPWYSAFQTAWRWGSFIAAHAIVALLLLAVIVTIQWVVLRVGDPKLFDKIPLRYIFDGMDLGILAAFVILGTAEAIAVFRVRRS
jgi:hypothetical protein